MVCCVCVLLWWLHVLFACSVFLLAFWVICCVFWVWFVMCFAVRLLCFEFYGWECMSWEWCSVFHACNIGYCVWWFVLGLVWGVGLMIVCFVWFGLICDCCVDVLVDCFDINTIIWHSPHQHQLPKSLLIKMNELITNSKWSHKVPVPWKSGCGIWTILVIFWSVWSQFGEVWPIWSLFLFHWDLFDCVLMIELVCGWGLMYWYVGMWW